MGTRHAKKAARIVGLVKPPDMWDLGMIGL